MSTTKLDQVAKHRTNQILLFVFSVIFFAIITYGYFNLFAGMGYFLAFLGSALVAVFAWFLARVVGTTPNGYRTHPLLFATLLVVSAAGVYNSMMLLVEGNRILSDSIADAQSRFGRLEATAQSGLRDIGATTRQNRVQSLTEALFSEIRNPLNCGQGPEARRIISDLQRELPGFMPLSNQGLDCSRNEEVISDYRDRINGLMARADWNNPILNGVVIESNQAQRTLEELRSSVTINYAPTMLRQTLSTLETHDALYRTLRRRLAPHVDVRDLPEQLHLSEVQSLGNAVKLPALILERWDQPATWFYLALAVGFDVLMVYLFQLVTGSRVRRSAAGHSIPGAW